jgi:hypothetical protein
MTCFLFYLNILTSVIGGRMYASNDHLPVLIHAHE